MRKLGYILEQGNKTNVKVFQTWRLFKIYTQAVFLISIAYWIIANKRLDLVQACPNRLKAIVGKNSANFWVI